MKILLDENFPLGLLRRLHDDAEDFLSGGTVPATVVVSRVKQSRRLTERTEVWRAAVRQLMQPRQERLFELLDDGTLVPWIVTQRSEGRPSR